MLNYIQWATFLIVLNMTKKKTDKKIPHLEPKFHDILICKKNDCRPFLEVLIEEPENISRQNLGILVGIFQIDDRSEDSSYVVNYLISVIKKEYFSRTNRGPIENFEAALHKANLALAKLATHENIGWIGKINAVCAVIEKNNLLLSQTGNASAFLLRNTTLTEITEIQDENIDSNPLKTFQDVISGKIEKDDKLIITTQEIFDIFSLEEIKKSALKFSHKNFIQFLNTALVNELDQVATLVVDISEKVEEIIEFLPAQKIEELNVFSQTAFQKELSPKMQAKEKIKEDAAIKERQEIIQELNGEMREPRDFVDKKTGHIYIKEPQSTPVNNSFKRPEIDFSTLKEKLAGLFFLGAKWLISAKNKIHYLGSFSSKHVGRKIINFSLFFWKKSRSKFSQIKFRKKIAANDAQELERKMPKIVEIKSIGIEKLKAVYSKLEIRTKTALILKKLKVSYVWLRDRAADGLVLLLRKPTSLTIKLIAFSKNKWRDYKAKDATKETSTKKYPWENIKNHPDSLEINREKTRSTLLQKAIELAQSLKLKKILPDFSHLGQIIKNLNQKQKISALIILMLLLVVPYWIAKWENKKTAEKPEIIEDAPVIVLPLEKDLLVSRIEKIDEVYAGNVTKILKLNDNFFALENTKIINLGSDKKLPDEKQTFSIPEEFQDPELFVAMRDLKSIFLIKNKQIISFSPITGKFQVTKLNFPEAGKIIDAKTYLTYIYLLDTTNDQIYRLPRAEGGFGEKTSWLKEDVSLVSSKGLAINENVFLLDDQGITKLFSGKKQTFSIENTATTVSPDKIYTEQNLINLYVLDRTNSRIIKLDNDGKILAQYYNAEIKSATDFAVNEDSNLIYLSNKDGVKSFRMN